MLGLTLNLPSRTGGLAYGIPRKTDTSPCILSTGLDHGLYPESGSGLSYKYT